MTSKPTLESALLTWLGWIAVCIAVFGGLLSLADPVAVVAPVAALLLAGVSALGGSLRFARIVGVIVAVTIGAVVITFPPSPPTSDISLPGFLAILFSPAYLIAWGVTVLGRRRARRRLAAVAPASAS